MILVRDAIKGLKPYVPGKTIEEVKRKYGLKDVIKLGSNENVLGPSPKALRAVKNSIKNLNLYPDSDALKLRKELANFWSVKLENVIVGNGSDEIMDLIARAFLNEGEKAIIPIPTFSYYEICVRVAGGKAVLVNLNENFELELENLFKKVDDKTKLIFVCTPNNPTGNTIPKSDIEKICENCGGIVVVDEAYAEFSDREDLVPLINEVDNLVVLRTFSKAYGLAGIRIGYGVGNARIVKNLLKIRPPFSVNLLAQEAAIAALKDTEFLERVKRMVKNGREYLFWELEKLGFKVFPSQANFLFVFTKSLGLTSKEVSQKLLEKGIIIRDCASFPGIGEEYVRITVGTKEQNKRVIEALREILK